MLESDLPKEKQTYTLTLRSPRDKYYAERLMVVFLFLISLVLSVTGFVIIGSILRRSSADGLGLASIIALFWTAGVGILTVFGIYSWLAAQREDKLVASDRGPSFLINDDGVSGSIVLLEGAQRSRLRKCEIPRFSLKWEEICQIRFVPGMHHPAKMRISPDTAGPEGATYLITREYFMGQEQHIVEVLQAHGVSVSVEDKLH